MLSDWSTVWSVRTSMHYQPSSGHGLPHNPFKAIVAPRPIGWISTVDTGGRPNLAPYSYFNAIADNPPLVMFSADTGKHSALNVRATGEFVVNVVGQHLAAKMVKTSIDAPAEVNEFEYAGLEATASKLVKAPRVAGVPAALECCVTEILEPRGRNGQSAHCEVVIGEVVSVYIDDAFLVDGRFDVARAGTVARLGYFDYLSVSQTFALQRPRWSVAVDS